MSFEIKIIEGHVSSSFFWFIPVILPNEGVITSDNIIELEEEFSIEEGDVECFLYHFFIKYFDKNSSYNIRRDEWEGGYCGGEFDPNLTHNFYTYDCLCDMINEILATASLMEYDYDNPELDDVKKHFSIFYMCSGDDADRINGSGDVVRKHISIVIDFYKRFTGRIIKMMKNNPDTNVISIMGP